MAQKPSPKERVVKLQHVEARSYLTALSDSSVVAVRADGLGALMHVHFLRFDNRPVSETFRVSDDGIRTNIVSATSVKTDEQKVLECTVMMRPDHALGLAITLLNTLRSLPQETRLMYNIPDIEDAGLGA